MSKRKVSKILIKITESSPDEESDSDDERIVIPDPNYSGSDGDFSSDDENAESGSTFPNVSYRSILDSYTETKKKLEPDHTFSWNTGETSTLVIVGQRKLCLRQTDDTCYIQVHCQP